MPRAVVLFQKSIMTMDGRLADAATAKARPTRKVTLTPLKMIPRMMAMKPTTKAVALPTMTFCLSFLMTLP